MISSPVSVTENEQCSKDENSILLSKSGLEEEAVQKVNETRAMNVQSPYEGVRFKLPSSSRNSSSSKERGSQSRVIASAGRHYRRRGSNDIKTFLEGSQKDLF